VHERGRVTAQHLWLCSVSVFASALWHAGVIIGCAAPLHFQYACRPASGMCVLHNLSSVAGSSLWAPSSCLPDHVNDLLRVWYARVCTCAGNGGPHCAKRTCTCAVPSVASRATPPAAAAVVELLQHHPASGRMCSLHVMSTAWSEMPQGRGRIRTVFNQVCAACFFWLLCFGARRWVLHNRVCISLVTGRCAVVVLQYPGACSLSMDSCPLCVSTRGGGGGDAAVGCTCNTSPAGLIASIWEASKVHDRSQ
jgi:hypothetical protein